jgi:hypothetical protein
MEAILRGTYRQPELLLRFGWGAKVPTTGKSLQEWVRALPGRTFDKTSSAWVITGIGENPDAILAAAGITVSYAYLPEGSDLIGVPLSDLVTPIAKLAANKRRVLVRHRFLGYDACAELLGRGAKWDAKTGRFTVPVTDMYLNNTPRPGIRHDPAALQGAYDALTQVHTLPEHAELVTAAGSAASMADLTDDQMAQLRSINGPVPAWFGLNLFPFQEIGALAVAAGHTGLFDGMRVGKTRTSLAAAALMKSHRTLIISPPLVVTNWMRNAEESQLATRGGKTDGKVVVFRAGRKAPALPATGIVIVADSLVAARPELRKQIAEWQPQVTILDEAHRASTYGTKRTEAVLDLASATTKRAMALTGTPIFSSPVELVSLLEFTGHLGPVFGGVDQFLTAYTTRDKYGRDNPKKRGLEGLQALLRKYVWVRRTKEQVGVGMPFRHDPMVIDVDLKLFREAHEEISDRIEDWIEEFQETHGRLPGEDDVEAYASESIGLISILRKAAGLAKIPAAIELIKEHVASTTVIGPDGQKIYTRPLIAWTHHREVTEAMAGALGDSVEESAMIIGGLSMTQKDKVVDSFQRGEIPVIGCSIIAAGVGIDLTRSADVMFVETDWTPANIQQALDRVQGVNQVRNVSAFTLIAPGTLDERLQKVQHTKGKTLNAVLGGDHDVSVAENVEEMLSLSQIIVDLVETQLIKRRKSTVKKT